MARGGETEIPAGGTGKNRRTTTAADLPDDVAHRIMAFAGTPEVRLVSRRARAEADAARRSLRVSGAGADGRPGRVVELFPNLECLSVQVRRADVWDAADPGPLKVCLYEELAERLATGVMQWVSACGSLRALRSACIDALESYLRMDTDRWSACHAAIVASTRRMPAPDRHFLSLPPRPPA